ncbi:hypothetical protein [Streptomyces sp. YS415]|uniref:hypothetical protein n=1 Tax=Streptomyces sp. YS415 TaxID=2944806 RepID=UPI0027E27A96|nr:hypothetical protein [Streptomyces sp. YS415]
MRDAGVLASAVRRPRARMVGTQACVDPYEQAAALLHALAMNHPLVDCDQDTAYDLVIAVASGGESDIAVIAGRLRQL